MSLMRVENLGKAYREYKTEWHRFGSWLGFTPQPKEEHWILRNLNFEIQPGEAIGVVGQNGAGKSTLLKLLTGTLQPTEGSVQVNGRIAAILELGMGFNPELSGRENVFHAAGLMGFSTTQIQEAMEDIEAFAEIGEYFDQPVRTYSSGMQMRVAFAVATAYRPEILIVDEALSVGDAYFQHKSFDRIRQFQEQGTTLLFVSHDKGAIQALCDRAILLSEGRIAMEGEPEAVMDFYNAMIADRENHKVEQKKGDDGKVQTVSGTGDVVVTKTQLLDAEEKPLKAGAVGQPVTLRVKARCINAVKTLVAGYMIKDRLGQSVFGTNTYYHDMILKDVVHGKEVQWDFCFDLNIGEGSYSVALALHADDTHVGKNYQWQDRALVFEVINVDKPPFQGQTWLPTEVRCSL